jgi:RimJ/RimL family protein N-acetyltransferase
VNVGRLKVGRCNEADIPYIMATERITGYEDLVGRWDAARHQAALADGRHAYFVARDGSEPVGFAIMRDWAAPERVTLLKRMAVSRPGIGYGKAMLTRLVDLVFSETDAYRLWLGVFPENCRARQIYEKVGFRAEGIARGNAYFGGIYRDELLMAVLRPDWVHRADHA